ncbi:hypothetical protein SERLA73DRAFT_71269 [Serpula lacrymans var. lacrymans S7.3]|uniref:Uncharacterized protein n=1 Tax=Serpula lacrymans var. lacrymans (strain S7.3) TaxID=936435 RepID=F8PPX7_SERL3|nr:hypothetical protein SERLA73DRAFT_71269 [Serpula lacrymans var. lacrymans S7.3]
MSVRRKSTVHDLASLRLHPDGSRVQQSSSNTRIRTAKYTTQDNRGNWIARDAGGLGKEIVIEGPMKGSETSTSKEKMTNDGEIDQAEADDTAMSWRDHRARKRRIFNKDMDYLTARSVSKTQQASGSHISLDIPPKSLTQLSTETLLEPSSDLLKCVHHFASRFYSDRGQLFDASKEYRQEKSERRLRRLSEKSPFKHVSLREESRESEMNDDHSTTDEEATSGKDSEKKEDEERESRSTKICQKDMYKVFDGSALIAIGMLLQEYVARTLVTTNPATPPQGASTTPELEQPPRKKRRRRIKKDIDF